MTVESVLVAVTTIGGIVSTCSRSQNQWRGLVVVEIPIGRWCTADFGVHTRPSPKSSPAKELVSNALEDEAIC